MSEYKDVCPKCGDPDYQVSGDPELIKGTRTMIRMCYCDVEECGHEWDEMWVFIKYKEPEHFDQDDEDEIEG